MKGLKNKIEQLLMQQKADWALARSNYELLAKVKSRTILLDGFEYDLQYNPERIRSCSAKIDAETLSKRPCFFCNCPTEQERLEYNNRFDILINPYPIFDHHLTIPAKKHQRQQIKLFFDDMLDIASNMDGYFIFYNGPLCGASAPDHMHFQAAKSENLPLWQHLKVSDRQLITASPSSSLYSLDNCPSAVLLLSTSDIVEANSIFDQIYDLLPIPEESYEPRMNIIAWKEEDIIQCAIFLRRALRPSCFYSENEETHFMISPASVEMAGLLVLPREEDYERLTPDVIRKVYEEVSLTKEAKRDLIKKLQKQLLL